MTKAEISRRALLGCAVAISAAAEFIPVTVHAQTAGMMNVTATAIGRPPIFSNTFADVGEQLGYFKQAGVDVTFRWFQRGTDTAKAVLTGDASIGFTSSQAGLELIAAGAPVIAVAGQANQDFFIGSSDPQVHGCADLKGQTIAADGINNARYLYAASLMRTCGLALSDVTLLDLANAALVKAAIAGQVKTAVFHIDELAQVEFRMKQKWQHIPTPPQVQGSLHYAMILANKDAIRDKREALVRFLQGWIMTQRTMGSSAPADQDTFAKIASKANGTDLQVAKAAIQDYQKINYWENNPGLPEKQIMSQLDQLVTVGSIKAENKPSFDKIVDTSLYAEAAKRVSAGADKPKP